MLEEFRKFLIKGNAVDMAVGFIFGAAFATLVKSFITNIIMPFIGLIMGEIDFSNLFFSLDGKEYSSLKIAEEAAAPIVKYGIAITDIINFIILGFIIFLMVRFINRIQKKEEEKLVKKSNDIILLEEIRDILKKNKKY